MARKLNLAAGILCGLASAANLGLYANRSNLPEAELLKSTAVYVQEYNGASAQEPIGYARRTLKVAARNDKISEEVDKLEKELEYLNTEIGESTNPKFYGPFLREFGDNMKDLVDENRRGYSRLLSGIFLGIASAIWFINSETGEGIDYYF